MHEPDPTAKQEVQDELGIPTPSPIPKTVDPDRQLPGTVNAQFNYNVNLPTVQLPSWEEFSKYSPEARAFWMEAGRKEQDSRHAWVDREQAFRHNYDYARLQASSKWRHTGQLSAFFLCALCITAGTVIILSGKSLTGFIAMLAGIVPLIGMAAYAMWKPPARADQEVNEGTESPPSVPEE